MLKTTRLFEASALITIETVKDEVVGSSKSLKPNVEVKGFFTSKAKIVFIKLRQLFTKAPIF